MHCTRTVGVCGVTTTFGVSTSVSITKLYPCHFRSTGVYGVTATFNVSTSVSVNECYKTLSM